MKIFLISIAMIVSILLILVIVLQEAKTAGMGAAVGGSSDSFFGGKARGKDAVLSKIYSDSGHFIRGHLYWTWTIFKYILIKGPCVKRGSFILRKPDRRYIWNKDQKDSSRRTRRKQGSKGFINPTECVWLSFDGCPS